jgi:hypothetical protein
VRNRPSESQRAGQTEEQQQLLLLLLSLAVAVLVCPGSLGYGSPDAHGPICVRARQRAVCVHLRLLFAVDLPAFIRGRLPNECYR